MRFLLPLLIASTALPALAEVPRVVTDLPPVHSLVAQVMGDLGEPVLLVEGGADAHSFQLRPSQAAALQEADLLVWMGPEMTPWLERALDGLTEATQLSLLHSDGTLLRALTDEARDEVAAEDGHEEGHDEEAHDAEGHDHGSTDPHAWLDPDNARLWLGQIAAALAVADPENAARYQANAEQAEAALAAMDQAIAAQLSPLASHPAVVFHDAYGYFSDHYRLTMPAAIAESDASSPGAQHLAAVEAVLRQGRTCLFPETNHDPKLAEQLAEATGATLGAPLDPEGATLPPGAGLYEALMRGLAANLAACLQR